MTALVPTSDVLATGGVRPRRPDDWMVRQLPVQMLDHDFFVRFVSIFQELGDSLLQDADNVDHVADVTVAPEGLLQWLGSWIAVDSLDESMPAELRRRIVSSAAKTLTWRGTTHGLTSFLELLSDGPAEVQEGGGVWRTGEAPQDTAWVRMTVRSTGLLDRAAFVDVVRDEVPAHVRAELFVGAECVWNSWEDRS